MINNTRELATILAALRTVQADKNIRLYFEDMPHFLDGETPMTDDEIEDLCERLDVDDAISVDDDDCTCEHRSWYGPEHDSACLLKGSR